MHDASIRHEALSRIADAPATAPAKSLICFSHLRWNFVFQRPQHLLIRAARTYRVHFLEEPVYNAVTQPRLDITVHPSGVRVAVPNLPVGASEAEAEQMQRSLLDTLLDTQGGPDLFWYYTPMALGFSGHRRADICVYDCMDELSAFQFAPAKLKARERDLLARADLVFTGGQSLYEAKRDSHPHVHAFPSSIDAAHFATARNGADAEPADQAAIPRPRLGYFGVIDERMDLKLLAEVAALRPGWQFVMIGPLAKISADDLPRRDNIHWLGGKSYEALPSYLAGWDVGLMPFAMNAATRYISPTKTPEFLAAGVPVVSTPVVDVVRSYGASGLVEIAADAAEVVAKAEALLARPKAEWLKRVDLALANQSWDQTWEAMQSLMETAQAGAAQAAAASLPTGNGLPRQPPATNEP